MRKGYKIADKRRFCLNAVCFPIVLILSIMFPVIIQSEGNVRPIKEPSHIITISKTQYLTPKISHTSIVVKTTKPVIKQAAVVYPGFIAHVTAYCCCKRCCGKDPTDPAYGITASGKHVKVNKTIAMSNKYPFGTLIKISGFGNIVFEVQDRGSGIDGNNIDVYMAQHAEALTYGVHDVKAWIIRYGK